MTQVSCHKCRQAVPHESDSWCLGCSAVEALSLELRNIWGSPGSRSVATDIVCSSLRQVRALRRLGLGGLAAVLVVTKVNSPNIPQVKRDFVPGVIGERRRTRRKGDEGAVGTRQVLFQESSRKKEDREPKEHGGKRRSHRGGAKHQRLYRAAEDPYRRYHQKRPEGYWDQPFTDFR